MLYQGGSTHCPSFASPDHAVLCFCQTGLNYASATPSAACLSLYRSDHNVAMPPHFTAIITAITGRGKPCFSLPSQAGLIYAFATHYFALRCYAYAFAYIFQQSKPCRALALPSKPFRCGSVPCAAEQIRRITCLFPTTLPKRTAPCHCSATGRCHDTHRSSATRGQQPHGSDSSR